MEQLPYRKQVCLAFLVENPMMWKGKRLVLSPRVATQQQITTRARLLSERKKVKYLKS